MPAKKVSSAAATTSSTKTAAAARLRKRSSLSLNGSTNGSEAPALAAVAAPVKRATVKARTPIASTPIAAQQATLSSSAAAAAAATPLVPASAACSGAAVAPTATASTAPRARTAASTHADPHTPSSTAGASVAAGTGSSSGATQHSAASDPSRKPTATTSSASKPLTSAVAPRPRASAASTPPPEAAAAVPTEVPAAATTITAVVTPSSNSNTATTGSSMSAAPVVRRQRSNVGAPASAPTTAATAASTPALTAGQHSMLSLLSGPPTPPPQGPSTEAAAAPHGTAAGAITRPRRASATTAHADGATHTGRTAATTESPSPPPAPVTTSADTAVEPHRVDHATGAASTGAVVARKRVGAAVASSSAKVRSAAKAPGTASVAPTTDAAATHSSAERSVKKKVVRRGSDGGTAAAGRTSTTLTATTTTLASRRNSARGSVSVPPTATSTAPPTRDPSVVLPPQTSAAAAAQPEPESHTSTTLNTARESVSEFESMALGTTVTTPNQTIASLGSFTRRSHGPVVSEEWARSIIKPGDEQLLYAPANAAFARTSSGTGLGGARGAAGSAQRASKGRSSPYDPQLRRAQQTVLQQRHIATPTPGRRSTRGVATGASAAPSAASGGSASRVGSTVKRSGTRLQQVRHEADERQRSLNATLATPNNEDGSVVRGHGSTVNNATGAPTPASPTPSRMSDGSVNTGLGGGGRLSAGTPISRRSTGSNDVPLEHIPGAASVMGGSYRHTPPGVSGSGGHYHQQHQQPSSSQQQRGGGTPSLALFARPTPRIFATPSPRGSTGTGSVPGMTTFGVSNAPYYTGNEELTKLTRVREDMLRAMLLSSSASTATATAPTAGAAAAASKPQDEAGATTPLSNSASSLLTMHVDPRVGEATTSGTTSPSAPKRPRQRVYGVDIRPGAAGEAAVSPQKTPAADVSKPRGRLSTGSNTAEAILVSSIRQKPSSANGVSPSRSPSVAAGGQAGAATRPKLNTGEATFSATDSATRLPRRSAVTVALTSLQPANALAERVRAELVRQQEQSSSGGGGAAAAAGSGDISKSDSTAATAAAAQPKPAPVSFEEATRRLLLDPFFPLVSEENYQRLVLQNDEYNERKELVVRICATPPPKPSWSASQRDREAAQPRRSGTVGPLAARALEMDLAEADEVLPTVLALDTTATPTTLPAPFSFTTTSPRGNNNSTSSNNGAGVSTGSGGGSAAAPRRPSVQYGGPNTYPSPSQSRARSPSPSAMPTSPQMAASLTLPSAPSPAREGGRLLVNAVMPSEKTGPIKPLALSGVWYVPAAAPADAAQSSAFQPTLSSSNLNNGAGTPAGGNSPHRAYSRSPSASRSSSRHNARRGSLLHGAQQNAPDAAALVSQSGSSDSESTASDDAVDEAEMALRRVLPRWGPFRTAAPAGPTTHAQNPRGASAASEVQLHPAGRRGRKPGDGRAAAAVLVQSAAAAAPTSTPGQPSPGALSPAMLDELDAYVHFFLKRFRNADADTKSELGGIPDTPLALQRAIRQSLRLSCGSSTNAEDDVEGVATELQDPLDDGSYHSQNVQYVLDLLGSLLQMQDSFCEDPTAGRAAARVSKGSKRNKARLTEADFLATVMWHPALDKSGRCDTDDDVQRSGVVGGGNVTRTVRKARARPLLRLRDPELHAVELMFALHNGGGGAAPEKK